MGDSYTETFKKPEWPGSASDWLKVVPWGFRKLLNWVKTTYGNPLVYITENGFSDSDTEGVEDHARIAYLRNYTNNVLKAINVDGCNVTKYTTWSIIDNFEW